MMLNFKFIRLSLIKNVRVKQYLVFSIIFAFIINPVYAATVFTDGAVQAIEAGLMPGNVVFASTANAVVCPQNPIYPGTQWLWFSSQNIETNKAVYAAVLSAYSSGKNLHLTWDTNTCQLASVRAI